MKSTTLQSKTVRPGLMRYSFYANERRPVSQSYSSKQKKRAKRNYHLSTLAILLVVAVISFFAYALIQPKPASPTQSNSVNKATPPPKSAPAAAAVVTNYCQGNTLTRFVKVSISLRHMWACDGSTTAYDSPVVTGIEYLAADNTPLGTYHIYDKLTDQVLTGSDTTGSWRDPVTYWMPFLDNQYGQYGFHDATWRANNAFGNIDPNSSDASHGCVELPLATAAWLYQWVDVGTTVTIVA